MSFPSASADKPSRFRCDASPFALKRCLTSAMSSEAEATECLFARDFRRSSLSRDDTWRFSAASSDRYLFDALLSPSISDLISLRAMRDISTFRILATLGMHRILPSPDVLRIPNVLRSTILIGQFGDVITSGTDWIERFSIALTASTPKQGG